MDSLCLLILQPVVQLPAMLLDEQVCQKHLLFLAVLEKELQQVVVAEDPQLDKELQLDGHVEPVLGEEQHEHFFSTKLFHYLYNQVLHPS